MNVRQSSRIILHNDRDEVLLFQHRGRTLQDVEEPGVGDYWVMPGGGLKPGESWEDAAIRELWEETGLTEFELGPWVWSREKQVVLGGVPTLGQERYIVVRTRNTHISVEHQEAHERLAYRRHAWWSVAEIRASDEVFFPRGLADLLEPLIAGEIPGELIQLTE
jgi:8-oxo-dGTP pyrophosphatase MutT (NUDIX family)